MESTPKLVEHLTSKRDRLDCVADAEIICKRNNDGTSLRCHRVILCACSRVFLEMFENKESEEAKSGKIIVKDSPAHVMKTLLDFIYQDGLENVSLDDVEELMKAAEKYKVDGLKTACEQELIKMLTVPNCVYMLHLAKKVGCDSLEEKARDLVKANIAILFDTKDYFLLMQDFPDALLKERE